MTEIEDKGESKRYIITKETESEERLRIYIMTDSKDKVSVKSISTDREYFFTVKV